tara:strand:+ start:616 stop:894 length:279 start_codon:yes stop_codon:yes gene_type:complete
MAIDKVEMHREMLKRIWLSIPEDENKEEIRVITVKSHSSDWHVVKIMTDVKSYYSSSSQGFRTLSEAIKYAKQRNKENDGVNDYTKYKLVIN